MRTIAPPHERVGSRDETICRNSMPNSVFLLGIMNGILSQHFISHFVVFAVVVVVFAVYVLLLFF